LSPGRSLPPAETLCSTRLGLHGARGRIAERIAAGITLPAGLPPELLPLDRVRFWVVDVETTGQGPPGKRVIEVAGVEVLAGARGRSFTTLVNPGVPLPEFITRLTGITPARLDQAPGPETIFPYLYQLFQDSALCAHSAAFDLGFLEREFELDPGRKLEAPVFCTVRLARRILPELKNHDLDTVAERLRLHFGRPGSSRGRHRALGDALIAAQVFLKFLRRLKPVGVATLADLTRFQNLPLRRAKAILRCGLLDRADQA
jgi:DNA polymerase III epsilon subunit family exonuclease